jgi:hypothetical protein
MRLLICILALAAFTVRSQTFPVLTVKGESFTNVTITNVTAAHATLYFDGGGKRVLISDLSPELQRQLGFQPAASAEELQKESAASEARKHQALEAWRAANCRILEGQIVNVRSLECVTGLVTKIIDGGALVNLDVIRMVNVPAERVGAVNTNGNNRIGGILPSRAPTIIRAHQEARVFTNTVFVKCDPSDVVESRRRIFWVQRDGVLQTNHNGSAYQFDRYTASRPYIQKP